MSDIRVAVQWKNSTVFAGEDIECKITFKNVSQGRNVRRSPSPSSQLCGHGSHRERWKETLPMRSGQAAPNVTNRIPPSISVFPQAKATTHKQALSLSTTNGSRHSPISSLPEGLSKASPSGGNKHRRSISIVSIGNDMVDETPIRGPALSSGRPGHGHARAASLQVLPKRGGALSAGPSSAPANDRAFSVPSPLLRASTSYAEQRSSVRAMQRPKPQTGWDTGLAVPTAGKKIRYPVPNFKFPQVPASIDEVSGYSSVPHQEAPHGSGRTLYPRPHEKGNGLDQLNPITRILSPGSIDGTPRSSGEFYSMSNNSTETLASEYVTQENSHLSHAPAHSRQLSYRLPTTPSEPEVLMMGYGQIAGSFTLDGSLVNQSPFEAVKKKGIIGGQGGGGVVRSESARRESGLLGSLGWGNIGESLGGLLGANELSSIKEARGSTSAKSIPILSTPQTILFVDLRLGPGESKSYTYRHSLPKGIPPTHKGRAIKISYSLVVGTQRAAKTAQQHQVQLADIPFRVLTSVNGQGEILGHDLMSPHTILSSISSTSNVDSFQQAGDLRKLAPSSKPSNSSPQAFLSYVETILDKPDQNSGGGLLSPTEVELSSLTPMMEEPNTMKEYIDLAILRSNASTSSKRSANRFEITRSGDRVAVITLARPAYRLGETIPVAIDFQEPDIPCYSLHATLETSETVDTTIALRSKASVHRVTRRIYASQFESTISAKKVLFSPMIPISSTPEFITSSVNLEWKLRFEFVTSRAGDIEELDEGLDDLMEEVARDERGSVKAAIQGLPCETFDVTVPLRVYGATAGFDEKTEAGDFPI